MEPLIALTVVTLLVLLAGRLGAERLRPWPVALRSGVAAMFVLTGVAHFVGLRADLVAMVPPALPAPELLVTVTGVLELAGAAGLFVARTRPWAAGGLAALLVVMFPANVHHALSAPDLPVVEQLPLRTAMQVVFLAAALAVLWADRRAATPAAAAREVSAAR